MKMGLPLLLVFAAAPLAQAEEPPYRGQDAREIKALAPERVEGLMSGAGLGYAKAAELNGWPGPLHVLELAADLELTDAQFAAVSDVRERMLAAAQELGERLLQAEARLDALFASGSPDPASIAAATAEIGVIEAELRAAHLTAHLETQPLLTRHQRMIYAERRGYPSAGGHQHAH